MMRYWQRQGYEDGIGGWPPKTRAFFAAAQIIQYYESYLSGYRSGRRSR